MNTQWYDIATKVAQHTYGVATLQLPMVRYRDGRVARINTPPEGSIPRPAAVLVIVTMQNDHAALVLTRRDGHLREHSGEIAFPGGRLEADETAQAGALREAHEELGIAASHLEIIGHLHSIYVPRSNHSVVPVMAWAATIPPMTPNPSEVAEVFLAPITDLLRADALVYEEREIRGESVIVPYFQVHNHRVWGATALMICDLVARIRALNNNAHTIHSHQTRTVL